MMEFLADLWLPILLSAVLIFVGSSILHMAIPIHKGDFKKLAGEDAIMKEMRQQGIQPGEYMFPCAPSMKESYSPEMLKKFKQGPVGFVTVLGVTNPGMGKNLAQWFLYSLLVSIFVAYIASFALGSDVEYMAIFRITGTTAMLAYSVANISNSVWRGVPWSTTLKFIFDGVVYGLLTAGAFAWLWPGRV